MINLADCCRVPRQISWLFGVQLQSSVYMSRALLQNNVPLVNSNGVIIRYDDWWCHVCNESRIVVHLVCCRPD